MPVKTVLITRIALQAAGLQCSMISVCPGYPLRDSLVCMLLPGLGAGSGSLTESSVGEPVFPEGWRKPLR